MIVAIVLHANTTTLSKIKPSKLNSVKWILHEIILVTAGPNHAVSLFSLRTFFTHCYQDILYTSEVYWMGWMGKSVRDRRVEFVIRASQGEGLSGLCREYEITRPTGYLWLRRFQQQGVTGMEERSRRPHVSPRQTSEAVEQRIVQLRRERPDWGARKLAVLLAQQGMMVPVVTVHRVLVRRGLV